MATPINAADLATSELQTDVLIIGGGPLGITTAIGLSQRGTNYILAESGGEYVGDNQDLAEGEIACGRYPDLDTSRIRALGGTTHVWGGHCAPLRKIDFAPRPWLDLPAWPITYEEFRPWVSKVTPLFGLKDAWSASDIDNPPTDLAALQLPSFDLETFRLSSVVPIAEGDFWMANNQEVKGKVVSGLTARRLIFGNTGRVTAVEFIKDDDQTVTISANRVVLAMGGIETARFLLLNAETGGSPLSAHTKIGVGFMEHPHPHMADLYTFENLPSHFHRYEQSDGSNARLSYYLKPQAQEQLRLPSFYFRFDTDSVGNGSVVERFTSHKNPLLGLFEQLPNDSRRVELSTTETDRFGDPLTRLCYFAGHKDHEAINDAVDLLSREFGSAGFGRVNLRMRRTTPDEPPKDMPWIGVGNHHLGTVRMAHTRKHGVVDANLKVFDTDNLYLATTGVFPTSSCVNPTLSGAAFAMRLSDHLAGDSQ